jgi:HK97 gp10 family phage protein
MPAEVDNSEFRELAASMKVAHGRVGAKGARVVRTHTLRTEARGIVYCPVDTGHLVSTVGSSFDGDGRSGEMTGTVSATASYAAYVHDGTSRQAPQPFLVDALRDTAPEYVAACAALAAESAIGR